MKKICLPLKKIGVCWFSHDITFGKGEISIITNHEDSLAFYYNQGFPAVCTSDDGRTLAAGIHLTQTLARYQHASQIHTIISKELGFDYAIHFVEREEDRQHVYSFGYLLPEQDFLTLAINNISRLEAFIYEYKKNAQPMIELASEPKHRIILPYGEAVWDISKIFSAQCIKVSNTQPLDFDTIFRISNEQLSGLLTKRRYPIQLTFGTISLSNMEIRTLIKLLKGLHAGEIAQALGIKQTTTESYLVNIKNKLSVGKKSDIIDRVAKEKILQQILL